jgi:D-alanine-D-alanine ligase
MKSIAILTGGASGERDIAIRSAQTVAKALEGKYEISTFDFPSEIDVFLARRREFAAAVPVFHGRGGEDGTVQGFLETLGVSYVFSEVTAHAVGMDKGLAKRVVASVGVKTGAVYPENGVVEFPCVVKPIDGGSTQGVAIVRNADELRAALKEAQRYSSRVFVEQFIAGDEFTVAVAHDHGEAIALPVIQIKSPNGFYDYAAKYGPQPAEKLCPAPISDELASRLQDAALLVHKTIGARHLSRTDFIVDSSGEIWFLEINTIPGLSVLFPRAVAASGRDFSDLLVQWIEEVSTSYISS